MNDLIEVIGLKAFINKRGKNTGIENFEAFYSNLATSEEPKLFRQKWRKDPNELLWAIDSR